MECELDGCTNPVRQGGRGRRALYCCNAHRQKALRLREDQVLSGNTPTTKILRKKPLAEDNPQAKYAIYLLSDPRDQQVYYVGKTRNVINRWDQHVNCASLNERKNQWIRSLKQERLFPLFTIIEVVKGDMLAKEREIYWIKHFSKLSPVLTNRAEVPKPLAE